MDGIYGPNKNWPLSLDLISKYNISLFHIDNLPVESALISEETMNKRARLRKIFSTCSWGECENAYDNLQPQDYEAIDSRIQQLEIAHFGIQGGNQKGGQLDTNMIRFLKKENSNSIDFYKNSPTVKTRYVSNDLTYYDSNKLLDILFKKNDNLELHKIFGIRGWTSSLNSNYIKSMFIIDKLDNNIIDSDYYDSFRNIYPVSWIEQKFAINSENLWKANNWFADTPHYRSLPHWKFEEVQPIEKPEDIINMFDSTQSGGITKNKNNNNSKPNFIKKYGLLIFFIILIICFIFAFKK